MFRVKKIHDGYHKLNRAGQVILIRLHTGHNRLNAHMNKKMKLVPSSMCICNIEDQTTEHILQRCPNHTNIKNQLWPDTTLQQKLYETLEELLVSFRHLAYQCNQANKAKKKDLFFGDDNFAGATVFFTSATRVVVPNDCVMDGSGQLVTEAVGHCFCVTG